MGVSTADQIEIGHPVLLAAGKNIYVEATDSKGRKAVAVDLAMSEAEVFPLAFELRVALRGEQHRRRGFVGK